MALLAVVLLPVAVLLYSGLRRLRDCCTENVEHAELLGDNMINMEHVENGENGVSTELKTSTNTFQSKKGEVSQWPLQVPRDV